MKTASPLVLLLGLTLVLCPVVGCGKPSSNAGGAADRANAAAVSPVPLAVVTRGAPATSATTTVVLLHGYGAGGDDLVDLARRMAVPATVRFVFPAAPISLDTSGASRAWWHLDPTADGARDRSDEIPAGIATARTQVDAVLDRLEAEGQQIVLGGFSQGAILAVDIALHRRRPLAALAVLSGTRINGAAWRAHLDRARGVPVLISHGTDDPVLPIAGARSLRDDLTSVGAAVDWVEFDGGHTLPDIALERLEHLITRVASARSPGPR